MRLYPARALVSISSLAVFGNYPAYCFAFLHDLEEAMIDRERLLYMQAV